MNHFSKWIRGGTSVALLTLTLLAPRDLRAIAVQQPADQQSQTPAPAPVKPDAAEPQPASPQPQTSQTLPDAALNEPATPSPQLNTKEDIPSAPLPQQPADPKPLGTAAAPYQPTTGITAARPAGAVIAPGRQKRARYFVIRIALVAGAVIAVGSVTALSLASSSRP